MRFPRASGILLHPTSLPGPHGCGDFGPAAYRFADWLASAGQKLWQVLPLVPTGLGNSPYMGTSAFAGNPLLIDLDELTARGWLVASSARMAVEFPSHSVDYGATIAFRMDMLRTAHAGFQVHATDTDRTTFAAFCATEAVWLDNFALFMAIASRYPDTAWNQWPAPLARREPGALQTARQQLAEEIQFWQFTQWCFQRQWLALKHYANERGVQLVGDIPIFIAYHSAEVWARPELFYLGDDLLPTVVAGVPPDYFSATGQRWGNPLYRWDVLEQEGYAWWVERLRHSMTLVDLVRIDHFRGFAGYWEIPAQETTAIHGRWVSGPGAKLFQAIEQALGRLPIIAEDLGVITPDVIELRDQFKLPGMRVLEFAFGGNAENPHLPHHYEANTVVYTGTHDNDTIRGWWNAASQRERSFASLYLGTDGHDIQWDLIRAASASIADLAIYPLQDVLGLGSEHRMNLPGQSDGHWQWRFTWDQLAPWHRERLAGMSAVHGRCDFSLAFPHQE